MVSFNTELTIGTVLRAISVYGSNSACYQPKMCASSNTDSQKPKRTRRCSMKSLELEQQNSEIVENAGSQIAAFFTPDVSMSLSIP